MFKSLPISTTETKPIRPAIELAAIYSKVEAAHLTGTSYSTIHRAIEAGKLRVARLNRRVAIRGAALLAWVEACEGGAQ